MNAHQDAREGQQAPSPAGVASVPTVDAVAVLAKHWMFDATPPDLGEKGYPPEYQCIEDLEPWRGDAETGGCEARLLAREVVALRERANEAEGRCAYAIAESHVFKAERDAAAGRVALLEGLLYTPDYAETYGLSPYVADGARCVHCQSPRGQGHQDFCPVGNYESALATARADGG